MAFRLLKKAVGIHQLTACGISRHYRRQLPKAVIKNYSPKLHLRRNIRREGKQQTKFHHLGIREVHSDLALAGGFLCYLYNKHSRHVTNADLKLMN